MREQCQSKNLNEPIRFSAASPSPCDCKNNLEVKVRKFGGGEHYVRQCNLCGQQRGNSINKTEALKLLGGKTPRDFDPSIEEKRKQADKPIIINKDLAVSALTSRFDEAQIRLSSVVDEIASGLTRDQVLAMLTEQVMALRKKIVEAKKKNVDRFKDEEELKAWFEARFYDDFIVHKNVKGIHKTISKNVYIDYVLFPRAHLVAAGFESCHLGVEVKYFSQEENFTHKTSTGIWQAISYNDCSFFMDTEVVDLRFTLMFSNLSFCQELELVNNFGNLLQNDLVLWHGLLQLAYYARVGNLVIMGDKCDFLGWEMLLARAPFFSCKIEKHHKVFKKSKHNLLDKDRIGNVDAH